eukprot:Gb_33523 [translate_table: standard]
MERSSSNGSILDGLGEEITRIISPVSICMLLVVLLVSLLNDSSSSASSSITTIATLIYSEQSSDSGWEKFGGALLNALVFVAIVTVVTFLLVCLFYYRCTKFLRFYMGFAAFIVLAYMGGGVAVLLVQALSIPIDCITFGIVLFNFAVVGVFSVFLCKMPIIFTQGYLVLIGMLVAYWFTMLPEWTTWVLLVAMAIYDVVAVLIPGGPLKILVELAISRDEEIPALIYEARPVTTAAPRIVVRHENAGPEEDPISSVPPSVQRLETLQRQRGIWKRREDSGSALWKWLNSRGSKTPASASSSLPHGVSDNDLTVAVEEEGRLLNESVGRGQTMREELIPLVNQQVNASTIVNQEVGSSPLPSLERLLSDTNGRRISDSFPQDSIPTAVAERDEDEGIGLAASGAIKLGLGDFIFYSVLVGRAAMYDYMTVYACYLAIIAGLGVTLILLAVCQKALPALPVSVSLGVIFYFLTRLLMEAFVIQLSTHLLLF